MTCGLVHNNKPALGESLLFAPVGLLSRQSSRLCWLSLLFFVSSLGLHRATAADDGKGEEAVAAAAAAGTSDRGVDEDELANSTETGVVF